MRLVKVNKTTRCFFLYDFRSFFLGQEDDYEIDDFVVPTRYDYDEEFSTKSRRNNEPTTIRNYYTTTRNTYE